MICEKLEVVHITIYVVCIQPCIVILYSAETYSDEGLIRKMEDYRDRWHTEASNYVKVNKDIEGLHSDVEVVRQILQDIEKGELHLLLVKWLPFVMVKF